MSWHQHHPLHHLCRVTCGRKQPTQNWGSSAYTCLQLTAFLKWSYFSSKIDKTPMLANRMLGCLRFTSFNQSQITPMLTYNVGKDVNSLKQSFYKKRFQKWKKVEHDISLTNNKYIQEQQNPPLSHHFYKKVFWNLICSRIRSY